MAPIDPRRDEMKRRMYAGLYGGRPNSFQAQLSPRDPKTRLNEWYIKNGSTWDLRRRKWVLPPIPHMELFDF